MSSPPDDKKEPEDEGTVFLPSGFQRANLRNSGTPYRTSSSWTQTGAVQGPGNALPLGTRLGEFEVTKVIGEGGFGIVYEAHDTSLERRVALKEYMPTELAERTSGLLVQCMDEDDEEVFRKGLDSFINEAKILARFDNPSLVKVYRFWEANGTAYMVMPYYDGPTLLEALRKLHQPPEEGWLLRLLDPLTEALAVIHDQLVYHRDISPDNILLLAGTGRPLLLDFGAARHVINDANQKAPTAIVKPGYAPVEQYSDMVMKQGPWSDVYALAAVLHFAITGRKPPAAISRLAGDAYMPLTTVAAGKYSPALLSAIDKALIVKPTERTQTMDALRAALGLKPLARDAQGLLVSTSSVPAGFEPGSSDAAHAPPTTRSRAYRAPVAESRSSIGAALAAHPRWAWTGGLLLALVAALLLVAGSVSWFHSSTVNESAQAPTAEVPANAPPSPPASAVAGPVDSPPPAVVPPAPVQPFSVVNEFARIQARSTPGFSVAVQWQKTTFRIGNRDLLAMNVTSMQDGYLYVLGYTPDNILFQYFPNDVSRGNLVRSQAVTRIPRAVTDPATKRIHEGIVLTDPPGKGHVLVIVSRYPRDFSLLGNKRESIYPVYPVSAQAEALHAQAGGTQSIYLGKVICPPGPVCEDQFAAAADTFDIVP